MLKMHRIVWSLVGLFALFCLTYPLAMYRVSQMEKFKGFHVQSEPLKSDKSVGKTP